MRIHGCQTQSGWNVMTMFEIAYQFSVKKEHYGNMVINCDVRFEGVLILLRFSLLKSARNDKSIGAVSIAM